MMLGAPSNKRALAGAQPPAFPLFPRPLMNPFRPREREVREALQGCADPRAAWELLDARGFLPDVFDTTLPRFACDAASLSFHQLEDSARCIDPHRNLWELSTPPSVQGCVAIASSLETVLAAEQLALESAARFRVWGTVAQRVHWYWGPASRPAREVSFQVWNLLDAKLNRAGGFRIASRHEYLERCNVQSQKLPSFLFWNFRIALEGHWNWDVASSSGMRVRPPRRKFHQPQEPLGSTALAGTPFAELQAPFAPLVELWRLGYCVHEVSHQGVFLTLL